jgi:DNA-directed RNA polymerase specialized sigma24 family protein
MTVSSWLRVCACERGHTLAAACSSRDPQDRAAASLRCLQRYSTAAIAEGSSSSDLTVAVLCSSARNHVGAQFIGAISAFLYVPPTSARFSC